METFSGKLTCQLLQEMASLPLLLLLQSGGGGLYYTGQSFQAKVGTLQYCGTVYSNEVQDGCSRSLLGLVMTAETRWPSCPTCYTPLKSA